MQRLHELLGSARYPNCRQVAFELEVSPKTIFRDLEFMRDQLKLPVRYDQKLHGYFYGHAVECPVALSIPVRESDASQTGPGCRQSEFGRDCGHLRKPIVARIWFDAQIAGEVTALYPANKRTLKKNANGSIELVVKDSLVNGLDRWILSWGSKARVIEPLWLRDKVRQIAHDLVDMYQAGAPNLSNRSSKTEESTEMSRRIS
jgi:hypothetical protein